MTLVKPFLTPKIEGYDLDLLNKDFTDLTPEDSLRKLFKTFDKSEILVTTSFGAKSIYLIDLIAKISPGQAVYFVDTGFHFEETHIYKKLIQDRFDIDIQALYPANAPHDLTAEEEWWRDHPRMCCAINKIAPLEPIIAKHKVWVSSLMKYQTPFRARLRIFEKQGDILKFHPMLDLKEEEFNGQINKLDLPLHPLSFMEYGSIGCTHCTVKGEGREGRWAGKSKTECGLHVKYFNKK